MHTLQERLAERLQRPSDIGSQAAPADGMPDRRIVLLQSALHFLHDARRFGDSFYRATVERQIREDLAALEGGA